MQKFSEIGIRVSRPKEILLFLLGLFSTLQILQLGGFALSTWLTVLTAGYLLLTQGFSFRKDWLLLTTLLCIGITFVVSMISDIPAAYKKASLMNTVQWGLIFVICAYMRREQSDASTASFFRGFDWSCKIQLIWCILQMAAYYGLGMDINAKLFGELLHMVSQTSQYRNGILACTGLHWHAANLIPVLIYVYFRYRNIFMKLLCFVIVYLTKNATAIVAIGLAVGLDALMFIKRTLVNRKCAVRHKVAAYIMLGVFGVVLISPILFPKLWEMVQYLLLRLYQIQNPTAGNESSAVHFNYYKNLPYILQNIPLREVLFGSGLNTSGYRFSFFFGQYADSIWTVESDFVNSALSRGIIGALLQYAFLFKTAWRTCRTKQSGLTAFIVVLLVSGLIYDNQFLWVQLLGFMLYCRSYQNQGENNL